MSELKPCPCCNGKADIVMMDEYYDGNTWVYHYSIECKTCGLVTRSDTDRVIAGELWNRRASPWISVTERLPSPSLCLAWIDDIGAPRVALFGTDFCDPLGQKVFESVTYWAELPSLPEGE